MSTVSQLPQLLPTKKIANTTSLLDRIKNEQLKLEEQLAVEYLNKTLNLTIPLGLVQQKLKDGIILCR